MRSAIALVVAAGLLLLGFVVYEPPRARIDPQAFGQALAVDRLLVAGVGSRVRLASAVDLVTRCVNLDAAVADLDTTAAQRRGQRQLLELIDVSR